ncbi:hypothetical protein [Halostagnicola kamekurae]|uniref:DUF7978 domain-containing protein n=1 Tax=Halostagnicola kamekurae TaxID=619731 RepID=A0A1I6RKZ3_9EURY|nr:hypothetical protein [Halostagnicola kamekurae]SFS65377.1 hypothetical protein SAMN04488556_1871 [Halostagnicola kamekurae]
MATRTNGSLENVPVVQGGIYGAIAFVASYLVSIVLLQGDLEFDLAGIAELVSENAFEAAGMLWFNSHFVDLEVNVIGLDTTTTMFAQAETGIPQVLYHVVPMLVLVAAGYLVGRRALGPEASLEDGVKAGATVVVGYLPLAATGAFVFAVDGSFGSAQPETATAILLAGAMFPLVFGSIGGIAATQ